MDGSVAEVRVLLAAGVDKDVKNEAGETQLHFARKMGLATMVAMLS
jgi:ankyrin repeat protein